MVFATLDLGDGAMRCRNCIQKIAAGEDKIQDEALVALAKVSCSKFDNAWAIWEKERGEEQTRRSVVERARIIRRAFNGPRSLESYLPYPVGNGEGEDIPAGTVESNKD